MTNNLDTDYALLVNKRKQLSPQGGFRNAADIENGIYDKETLLEPLAHWHCKIPANILLVGQDWGGEKYYRDNNGRDNDSNPTCINLQKLFKVVGIDIGCPSKPSTHSLHFTNIIPFIRKGAMQGSLSPLITQETINQYAHSFTQPLIEIVKPQIIIALGFTATKAILQLYNINVSKSQSLKNLVERSPFSVSNSPLIFPVYHCGSSTINRNRSLEQQKMDWLKIKQFI